MGADGVRRTLDDLIATAKGAERAGFDNLWLANIFAFDAISVLTLIGRETQRIGLGGAVTPTYPRHPTAMAQQALTAQAACKGRFTLGIGLSHKRVVEDMLGLSYRRRAAHMREYLKVLMPLVRGETVNWQGEEYRVRGLSLDVPGGEGMPVLVAALGAAMLKVAGEQADGTSTWMVGPKTMAGHIVPKLTEAAAAAGRPPPRVVGGCPIALVARPDEARAAVGKGLSIYGQMPSYQAMLDLEGAHGPEDIALLGDESLLRRGIRRFQDMGVTDFNAAIMDVEAGAYDRTLAFLADVKG